MAETPTTAEPLTVTVGPGLVPTLASPIPRWVLFDLSMVNTAPVREWLDVTADAITICGHTFRVAAWSDRDKALVCQHACCLDWTPPTFRQLGPGEFVGDE